MDWPVVMHDEFAAWLREQEPDVRKLVGKYAGILSSKGPGLGRPQVGNCSELSAYPNMKTLRMNRVNKPWRVLFAFDPTRTAILLAGGNKAESNHWYRTVAPIADRRYGQHLARLEARSQCRA